MKTEILGGNLPVLVCKLDKGEQVYTETGGMSWMTQGIKMDTNTNGGIMKGIGRAFAGESIIAQKKAFLCAEKTVNMAMHFRKKIGAGFFGGEGFIMQKLSGNGKAFLEIDGCVVKKELSAGEILEVDNGYVAAMTEGVELDIKTVKGLKNIVFGGEGLFLTTVKGPGTVWLQSMPVSKLAGTIYATMPSSK